FPKRPACWNNYFLALRGKDQGAEIGGSDRSALGLDHDRFAQARRSADAAGFAGLVTVLLIVGFAIVAVAASTLFRCSFSKCISRRSWSSSQLSTSNLQKFGRLTSDELKHGNPIVGDNVRKVLSSIEAISTALEILRGHMGNPPTWVGGRF